MLRDGKKGIVVCTSSLELGIDIGSVETVIHYGSPHQVSKLVQRIGRSRHRNNESAHGLVITGRLDDYTETRALLSRLQQNGMEKQHIHDTPPRRTGTPHGRFAIPVRQPHNKRK